jgi:hypothetical protein
MRVMPIGIWADLSPGDLGSEADRDGPGRNKRSDQLAVLAVAGVCYPEWIS